MSEDSLMDDIIVLCDETGTWWTKVDTLDQSRKYRDLAKAKGYQWNVRWEGNVSIHVIHAGYLDNDQWQAIFALVFGEAHD
jgi:hypothetical protein